MPYQSYNGTGAYDEYWYERHLCLTPLSTWKARQYGSNGRRRPTIAVAKSVCNLGHPVADRPASSTEIGFIEAACQPNRRIPP